MKSATLRDVAARAGVHPGTASRALNPETRSRVKESTVRRVVAAARELEYRPNPMARGMRISKSFTVGMLIPDLTNPLFPPIVRGVEDVLAEQSYAVLLANTDNDPDREQELFDTLRVRQVDGFILGTALREHPLTTRAVAEKIPVVLVNRLTQDSAVPAVVSDDASGTAMAVAHLVGLGHDKISYIAGPQTTSTGVTRLWAYRQALGEHGLRADENLVVHTSAWSESEGARAMQGLLDRDARASAVVAGNDLLALGCYDVLAERGLRCPDDVSVVGFNDIMVVDKLHPPLTTVHVPTYGIGAEAARLLLQRIDQPDAPPRKTVLPVELIVRGSTAAPR